MAGDPPTEAVEAVPADDNTEDEKDEMEEVEVVHDPQQQARQEAEAMNLQAVVEELENKQALLVEQHDKVKEQLESQSGALEEARNQVKTLSEEKLDLEQKYAQAHRNEQLNLQKCTTLEEQQKAQKERMDRVESEADSLREEISRLTKSNKEFQENLSEMDVKSKLGHSELMPLVYEKQRIQHELDSVSSHSLWLEGELKRQSDENLELKKKHSSTAVNLGNEIDQLKRDKETAETRATSLETTEQTLQTKVNQLSKELMQKKQEAVDSALRSEQELAAERRLVELQKEQLDRLEKKYDDVVREMEAMQGKATDAIEAARVERQERQEKQGQYLQKALEDQAAKHKSLVEALNQQLGEANRRRVEVEDKFLALPTGTGRRSAPLAITDGMDEDEPISLTDLSTRLAQARNELVAEQTRRRKVELRFERVQADIEAKAPVLIRQRQEYEFAMKRQEEYQRRLDDAMEETTLYRAEARDLRADLSLVERKYRNLEQESKDLAKQVQALLYNKSGEAEGDIPTSIEEIQSQNQRLLGEHRRLTSTIKELEEKLKSDTLRNKLESTEKELSMLQEDRRQQEILVAGIVQQRDLYRALLAKHDSKLLGTEEEEVTAIEMTKRQSGRAKALEDKNHELENELAAARGDLDRANREKDNIAERLSRHETMVRNLTQSVDNLQMEVSTAKSDQARTKAECSYYSEKTSRLEESLRVAKEENDHVRNAKSELQRINNELQNSLSNAESQTSRAEGERRQMEQKHRMAEAQVATLKAAEKRTLEENNQLRNEIARQGALLDSVRRIEASLSAKNDEESSKVKEDCERLTQQLANQGSKHTLEVENLSSKINDLEIRAKELESSKEKAQKESLLAQKNVLTKEAEIQKLNTKCSTLASQLHEIRKKYGETDDSTDVDVTLQARIKSLSSELESAKAELSTQKEASENFQRIAKTSETALADLTKSSQEYKKAHDEEVGKLNAKIEELQKETRTKQEVVAELTNDLMKQRGEQDKATEDLKAQVESLKKQMEGYEKDTESANARVAALKLDLEFLREEESKAQNNYERELTQHAAARTELRKARSEAEEERRNRVTAEENMTSMKKELDELRTSFEEDKKSVVAALENAEKMLKESQAQNELLHNQLETLGNLAEKNQESRVAAAAGDAEAEAPLDGTDAEVNALNKTISELREVIRFLRSEKEMNQAQLDAAKRTAERERAAANVAKRGLDEARAELEIATKAGSTEAEGSDLKEVTEKLQSADDQLRLLRDSNHLLREENEKLQKSLTSLQNDLNTAKKSSLPSEKRLRDLEVEKAALEAEKASLTREIESWKGRVQSLVTKFNQIDPEEHKQALAKLETLTKENSTFKSDKESAEKESTRIRSIASRLNKELAQHKKTVAELTQQKEALAKASKNAQPSTETKEKLAKLEKELNSTKTELIGANERTNKLRERLRQFQKMIKDLRAKEKTLTEQLTEAQSTQQTGTASAASGAPAPASEATVVTEGANAKQKASEPSTKQEENKSTNAPPKKSDQPASAATAPAPAPVPAPPAATIAKTSRDELLRLPPGGFKFGPNEGTKTSRPVSEQTTQPDNAQATSQQSTTEPAPAALRATSPKAATGAAPAPSPAAVARSTSPKPAPEDTGDSAEKAPRRDSGSTKEMSFKEKLLEKKRKLMEQHAKLAEKMKQQEEAESKQTGAEEAESKQADDSGSSEPALKKPKLGEGGDEADQIMADDQAKESIPAASEQQIQEQGGDDEEEGEVAEEVTTEGAKEIEQKGTDATPTESAPAPGPITMSFGQPSGGFGAAAAGAPAPAFGTSTGSPAPAFGTSAGSPAPAFGTSGNVSNPFGTTFGSSAGSSNITFGSAAGAPVPGFGTASGAPTSFAAAAGFSSGTTFGGQAASSTEAPDSSTGGSFLKSAGAAAAPTFQFGNSGSITLPTPSQPSRSNSNNSPFGVFSGSGQSSGSPFGVFGAGARPLFGSQPAAIASAEETKQEETQSQPQEGEVMEEPAGEGQADE